MRKVLCTLAVGPHQELLEIVRPTFEAYAARHGYDFVVETRSLDTARPISWSKVLLLQRLMNDYDFVFWIDCDAVVVDASFDVVDDLPKRASFGVVAHETLEGREIPNSAWLRCGRRVGPGAFSIGCGSESSTPSTSGGRTLPSWNCSDTRSKRR